RKDKRGFDLISDALPFGGLWYLQVADAIDIRATLQPRTRCSSQCLRCGGQSDRSAQAQGRFQKNVTKTCSHGRVVAPAAVFASFIDCSRPLAARACSLPVARSLCVAPQ